MIDVIVCPPIDMAAQFVASLPAVPRVGEIIYDGSHHWTVERVTYTLNGTVLLRVAC